MGLYSKLDDAWANAFPEYAQRRAREKKANLLSDLALDDALAAREAKQNLLSGQFDAAPSGLSREVFNPGSNPISGGLDDDGIYWNQGKAEDVGAKRNALTAMNPKPMIDAEFERLFPEKVKPVALGTNQRLVNPVTGAEVVGAGADEGGFKRGAIREVQRGGVKVTQEFDGTTWQDIAEGPAWKPDADAPERPPANDYEVDPNDSTKRRMVRGGSAAVAQAERLATPVVAERKLYNEAATQYATLADLANDDTGASDIGIIYGFFKAADPISSVRESEFETVGAKMGLSNAVIGAMKSVASGKGFLTPKVRQALVDTAGRSIKNRKGALRKSYNDTIKALDPLGVDRKAFLPFSVTDVDLADVRKQYPSAQQDTAGRVYIMQGKKRAYIEVDD